MPTKDSSEPEPCAKCGDTIKGYRWQAAISDFVDSETSQGGGSRGKGRGWHWVSVCTPCFWRHRTPKGVGVRGPLLEEELR